VQYEEKKKYDLWFPLQDWGWDRARCIQEILKEGLPEPSKSSCYFCTAMKPWEVDELPVEKLKRIVILEARTKERHLEYAKTYNQGMKAVLTKLVGVKFFTYINAMKWDGKPKVDGIWRSPVKGMRGATKRPGSMTEYIREKTLLPGVEIDRLISITPTKEFSKAEFDASGILNWQDWLKRITG
jgi:hypothetical protein